MSSPRERMEEDARENIGFMPEDMPQTDWEEIKDCAANMEVAHYLALTHTDYVYDIEPRDLKMCNKCGVVDFQTAKYWQQIGEMNTHFISRTYDSDGRLEQYEYFEAEDMFDTFTTGQLCPKCAGKAIAQGFI